ncbi:hypothetical protein FM038_020445 [Shewanella eurypsychrophilus]|uniref:AbrB/MazE/SpoVT family DNA-binding domain-containing protein n=1 Tax=Shewanella eurypsychrophilus TaxID=2593656 RepID=A0ABX6VA01_9GAMM|nr:MULTISPECIES: hypothetical protein [Shewanella]QFU24285.1 hypothetical protein FS418_22160 [Shewanella sp. YLB-09]QPG59486.1 hypothetical protein FM038_020445 [Shewanella eurypsychrophilus]
MTVLKIQHVGKGLGLELPQEVVERLHVGNGDSICLEKMSHDCYRLVSKDDDLAEQMTQIEDYMHEEDA